MPSTATITTFNTFSPGTKAKSGEVNANFANYRGHLIPVETDTAASSHQEHDLGSSDHEWRTIYLTNTPIVNGVTMSSGGAGGGSGIESLEDKALHEHYGIYTNSKDYSLYQSFALQMPSITASLMEDLQPGTTTVYGLIWDTVHIDSSNPNFDYKASTTSAISGIASANVNANTTTAKAGADSVSFDKSTGNVRAGFWVSVASTDSVSVNDQTEMWFWLNMPSVTDLHSFEIRLSSEAAAPTNYEEYTLTTDYAGNAIATGWNLMKVDIGTTGSSGGSGWSASDLLRTIGVLVRTNSSSTTYTDICVDSLRFGRGNPTRFAQKGSEYTIYDTSDGDTESIKISNASSLVQGVVTLASALSNTFTAENVAIKRTVATTGDNLAVFNDDLTGTSADQQEIRYGRMFRTSLSGAQFQSSVLYYSNLIHEVTAVNSTTQIEVEDLASVTSEWLAGDKYDVYEVQYLDNKRYFISRDLQVTLSLASTISTSTLTLNNTGTNLGIQVGDYVVKANQIQTYFSLVGKTADESFGTALSATTKLLEDFGLKYPGESHVVAHWLLGGDSTEAVKNRKGTVADLTVVGTIPSFRRSFKNGQFGSGVFSDSNYYRINDAPAETEPDGTSIAGSIWLYPLSTSVGTLISRTDASGQGFHIWMATSGGIRLSINAVNDRVTTPLAPTNNRWNHIAWFLQDNGDQVVWLNGNRSENTTAQNVAALTSTEDLLVGRYRNSSSESPIDFGYMADLILWRNYRLSDSDVKALYNNGIHIPLIPKPAFKELYTLNSQSGQKASVKHVMNRRSALGIPILLSAQTIKTG